MNERCSPTASQIPAARCNRNEGETEGQNPPTRDLDTQLNNLPSWCPTDRGLTGPERTICRQLGLPQSALLGRGEFGRSRRAIRTTYSSPSVERHRSLPIRHVSSVELRQHQNYDRTGSCRHYRTCQPVTSRLIFWEWTRLGVHFPVFGIGSSYSFVSMGSMNLSALNLLNLWIFLLIIMYSCPDNSFPRFLHLFLYYYYYYYYIYFFTLGIDPEG